MCLTEIKRGQSVQVVRICDGGIRIQLLRIGIGEGSRLECLEKIPFGPLMIRHNRQEIAIGREVAKNILIQGGPESCR